MAWAGEGVWLSKMPVEMQRKKTKRQEEGNSGSGRVANCLDVQKSIAELFLDKDLESPRNRVSSVDVHKTFSKHA